jgi:TetR/AcrR family transcriptional regulator, mexJK operon transcriptional repressor
MVAVRASVSKQTVYNSFSSKDDLIGRVTQAIVDELTRDLESSFASDDVRAALMAFGGRYLRMVGNPERTNFMRMIIGSAARGDNTAQTFFRAGPRILMDRLADFLANQTRLGHMQSHNSALAAEQFIGLVLGTLQLRFLLGVDMVWTEALQQERVASAVSMFLKSYGVDQS